MTNDQIKLIQTAARAAGIRDGRQDGRYRFLLAQYKKSNGQIVASCKDLNNYQVDDFLAICESHGWRHPGLSETHYRDKVARSYDGHYASDAQRRAIDYLAGDLGMGGEPLKHFILRMTRNKTDSVSQLTGRQAYNVIEALKAALSRKTGRAYDTLNDVSTYFKDENHGREDRIEETCPI